MLLNENNYYSKEADEEYLSVSQVKDFLGSLGRTGCEAQALAKLKGEWIPESTSSLLIGSYVDSWVDGTLAKFKEDHPEIFLKTGGLKAEFRTAESVIERIKRDEYFMAHLAGEHQKIMTGELFGAKWKIKMDSYFPDKLIVDLKVMKNLREAHYAKDAGHMNFVRYWGYDLQAAVYQKIVEQNTGKKLPFRIAAVSKEKFPDISVIQLEQSMLDEALASIEDKIPMILALKNGEAEPIRCEVCDYCKNSRVLTEAIWSEDLLGEV